MCLMISKATKREVAEHDITVFKILKKTEGGYITPYRKQPFPIGEVLTSELGEREYGESLYDYIEVGLHSFAELPDAKIVMSELLFTNGCEYVIFAAVIPKGSQYYLGRFGYYVPSYASTALQVLQDANLFYKEY